MFSDLTPGFLLDVMPFKLSGTVYGTLLNQRSAIDAMGEFASKPPYNAPPKAPVLYIKPRNTLAASGEIVTVPDDVEEVEVGACLGLVIARTACQVQAASALDFVAGYLAVNDLSVPHPNYYRPSIRYKARDGFCPLGVMTRRDLIANPDDLVVKTFIDDVLAAEAHTSGSLRNVSTLLRDVTDFMTLAPGDILAIGVAGYAPRARRGQTVRIQIEGLETLTTPLGANP